MPYLGNVTIGPKNVTTTQEPTEVESDETEYIIVPLVVIVLVMLLSLLVYCMVKRRRIHLQLRRDFARLYEFDEKECEWEALNSYEQPYYSSGEYTPIYSRRQSNYMPTTNL